MSFLSSLKSDSEAIVSAPDGRAYKIRRVNSTDLLEHAHAELVGGVSTMDALNQIKAEIAQAETAWRREHVPEDQRDAFDSKRAAIEERKAQAEQEAVIRALARDARTLEQQLARVDAYCCAGIIGGGEAKTGRAPNYPTKQPDTYVGRITADETNGIAPVRFTRAESDEDLEAGIGWVGRIDAETRNWLCGAISRFSGSPTAKTFRS